MELIAKVVPRDDITQVLDLIDQFERPVAPRPSESEIENAFRALTAYGGAVVGVYRGSQLLATCTVNICANLNWSARPYAIIENVIVDREHRGRGIGKKLLSFAVELAQQQQCYKVALMTGSKRDSTLKFYEAAGFEASKTGFQIRFQSGTQS